MTEPASELRPRPFWQGSGCLKVVIVVTVGCIAIALLTGEDPLIALSTIGVGLAGPFAIGFATRGRRVALFVAVPFALAALVCFVGAATFWSDTSDPFFSERDLAIMYGILCLIAAPIVWGVGLLGVRSRRATVEDEATRA